jgi:phosphate-selective porin OprO/OprP
MTSSRITTACLWLGVGFLNWGFAQSPPASSPPSSNTGTTGILSGKLADGSTYDQLWSVPLLYKNEANPLLQELAIQGQLQTQIASGSDDGESFGTADLPDNCTWGDIEVRRFRLGLRARLLRSWKFHSLLDLYPDFSPHFYKGIAETYLTYAPCDALNFSLGKTELKFTREQEASSRDTLPFERSQLVNMFYGGELTGAWISGKGIGGGWLYELGAYGNDRQDEWTELHGGTMILAKVGYNYTKGSGFDFAQAALHYLHNTEPGYRESAAAPPSPKFSDCLALANDLTKGRFSLATELFWGDGVMGQPDVCGFSMMPTYFLAEKLQLVTTFQLAGSRDPNGVTLPGRYEGLARGSGDKKGDAYFAGYAGLNYYFYGHKMKVMSGVKYSDMSGGPGGGDFSGWTWLAGFRSAF